MALRRCEIKARGNGSKASNGFRLHKNRTSRTQFSAGISGPKQLDAVSEFVTNSGKFDGYVSRQNHKTKNFFVRPKWRYFYSVSHLQIAATNAQVCAFEHILNLKRKISGRGYPKLKPGGSDNRERMLIAVSPSFRGGGKPDGPNQRTDGSDSADPCRIVSWCRGGIGYKNCAKVTKEKANDRRSYYAR